MLMAVSIVFRMECVLHWRVQRAIRPYAPYRHHEPPKSDMKGR